MLKKLKHSTVQFLRRRGLRISRIPIDKYELNARVGEANRDEILRIAREETEKQPNVRPTWFIAKHYLDWRRISFYCDMADLLAECQVPMAGRRVLEIGSYFGVLLRLLHQRYPTAKLHGSECLDKALAVARRVCPQADIHNEPVESLSFDSEFDLVIMSEVLEHMVDPAGELHRLEKLVAPDGYLFVTVPNGRYDAGAADEFMPEFKSYRGHINFWSPESWQYFLEYTFPGWTIRTGHMPKQYVYQLYGLIRKPSLQP